MNHFHTKCHILLVGLLCLALPALSFADIVNTATAAYKDQPGVTNFNATSNTVTVGVLPTVSTATVTGVQQTALSYTIVATQSPTTYSIVSGTLPAGLTLAPGSSGVISGTPTAAGTTSVVVGATNAAGRNTATLTFNISAPAAPLITLTKSANPTTAKLGDTVTFLITYTNVGVGVASNLVIQDVVPSGVTIGTINNGGVPSGNTITWTIAGTVAANGGNGSVSFTVHVL